jgi:kinesin family protein 3/17
VITTLDDNRTVSINHPQKQLQCEYDYSFPQSAAQEEIYDKVNSCVNSFTNGFNATIFAYGQTGSGKTHTMFGPEGYAVQRSSFGGPNHAILNANAGVIPRSIVQIFKNLNRKDLGIVSVTAYVSFVQVYNEQLYDMLRDPRRSR